MHVIITGGSSGIGLEVARQLCCDGYDISLIARDSDRLETARAMLQAISLRKIHVVCADVSHADDLENAISACEHQNGPCDLLVTSAGIVEPDLFSQGNATSFDNQMAINFAGTVNAVRAVYPGMIKRHSGTIMMVSSGAALIGIPGYTAYCASKAAIRLFAEALRAEAAPHGVAISVCFPPDTHTPQLEREITMRPEPAQVLMGRVEPWPVANVARVIVSALKHRRAEVHFGFHLRALAWFGTWIKPFLYWHLRHRAQA